MSGLVYALALFGCTDDGTICERLQGPATTYQSRVECMASQNDALGSHEALSSDYPSVFAQCMTRGELVAMGKGQVDLTKSPQAYASAD
ncbi:hypothetical protein B2G71_09940 [Novosphingobium sp. PC22D]|uniref:hypothetical protein n=1 Tax=Novosphingobium sp. PC22D TaxID=1962403 RepID=UPI000BF0BAC1|nr:hypothetical protein [Novosphingobium sp. PC22D]PEQ12625.1 hypothetical protein B2G71_09940 [Novosphingobium sp. PC22D]